MESCADARARRERLRALLAACRPADRREQLALARFEELLDSPGDPFSRSHFTPGHVTVSAFVTSSRGGELLMIHHGRLGRWLQPGGHVERMDADLVTAAAREVLEETGLEVAPTDPGVFDLDVHPIPERAAEPAHLHFDVRFALRGRTEELRPGDEVRGVRWVAFDEVARLNGEASMLRVLGKLRRLTVG